MIEYLRRALRERPLLGVAFSVAIHAALLLLLIGVHPARTSQQKKGDALIVELPSLQEPATSGTPGPQASETPTPAAPATRPTPPAPPAPRARPTPPPVPPRPQVAAAPKAEPRAVPSAPQPPPVEGGDVPVAKAAPQPAPETPRAAPAPPAPQPQTPVASAPPPGPIAMIPPAPPDIRSAFRRGGGGGGIGAGGAGGTAVGRGGIVGEPLPLESKDSDLADYFERIKRLIKQNWVYPCVKDARTSVCEYKSAELIIEFGILKPGPVQYVEVMRASPWGIYNDYAVNAIKLASPFPPVPPAVMARMSKGSNGAAITARFVYVYEAGLTNVLR
jgi:outer membrane biosynthesis protein TonB